MTRFTPLLIAGLISIALEAQAQGTVLHKVMDKNGTGGLAMTFEVPKGWATTDTVRWDLNLRMNPMSYTLSTGSPDGRSWISYLSGLTFGFTSNGGGKQPPAHASDFLLEDFRATHPGMQFEIVEQQNAPIPYPYAPSGPGVIALARHSVITVRFQGQKGPMLERLSYDFFGYTLATGGGSYVGNWLVNGLTVVNAPEGQLEGMERISNSILSSERMTTAFQNRYQQVAEMLLERTKAEGREAQRQRAQRVVSGGGGGHAHIMDKDEFILHEAIKGLRSRMFSRSIGN